MDTQQINDFNRAIASLEESKPTIKTLPNTWAKLQILKLRLHETICFELSWSGQYYTNVNENEIFDFLKQVKQ